MTIEVLRDRGPRLCQGDILKNVEHIESVDEQSGFISVTKIVFPYVIVLTQDCDLAQDYRFRSAENKSHDKYLISILVAPLYNYEHFISGQHLSELGSSMRVFNKKSTAWTMLTQNETPRYHYVDFPFGTTIVPSVIDFKHYFSVNLDYLKSAYHSAFVCRIAELYREDISIRFASFLSRIGLPE